jgi:hypothetical protein
MLYNPITASLFATDGTLIKRLHCPLQQQWAQLVTVTDAAKVCWACAKPVYDTALLDEGEVRALLDLYPGTCLKIDLNQPHITLTYAPEYND